MLKNNSGLKSDADNTESENDDPVAELSLGKSIVAMELNSGKDK